MNRPKKSLQKYVQNSKERLVLENVETSDAFKARHKAGSDSDWQDKPLHGQFTRQNKDQRNAKT